MFGQVYELLTGTKSDGFTILEFTYCIGIVIGILTFFNHFGKKSIVGRSDTDGGGDASLRE